jgi:hypothetical protein
MHFSRQKCRSVCENATPTEVSDSSVITELSFEIRVRPLLKSSATVLSGVPKWPNAQNSFQTVARSNSAAYSSSRPLDGGLRFVKTLLISFVLVVNPCLTSGASANAPPTEITDTFFSGEIVQYYELVGDGEIKYVGMIRYGRY